MRPPLYVASTPFHPWDEGAVPSDINQLIPCELLSVLYELLRAELNGGLGQKKKKEKKGGRGGSIYISSTVVLYISFASLPPYLIWLVSFKLYRSNLSPSLSWSQLSCLLGLFL